jgi:hypothetical protein
MTFRLQSRIPEVSAQLRKRAADLVTATAFGIKQRAQVSMSGPKSGQTYKRGSRTHQASAPGEAPAIDQGDLVNSIDVVKTGELSASVGSSIEHGVHMEFGTVHVEPRPWLGPAFEEARPEFEQGLKGLIG